MKTIPSLVLGAAAALAHPAWADLSLAVDAAQAAGRPAWRAKVVTAQGEVRVILIDLARVRDASGLDAADTGRPSLTQAHGGSGAQR